MRIMPPLLLIALLFFQGKAYAGANLIQDKATAQAEKIEAIIQQQLDLRKHAHIKYAHPISVQDYGVSIRNPFTDLPQKTLDALKQEGIDLKAMSRYRAIYIAGGLTGASAVKLVNPDPACILVIGRGSMTHDPIYSRGPIVVVGHSRLMDQVYSKSLLWFGSMASGGEQSIGLPVIISKGKHDLGVSPYSAAEEIKASIQLKSHHSHRQPFKEFVTPIDNPLAALNAVQLAALKKQGIPVNDLLKQSAVQLKGGVTDDLVNADPNVMLVIPEDYAVPGIFTLGSIISHQKDEGYLSPLI